MNPKTPVLFRVDRLGVYALFPTIPGTHAPSTCNCYASAGQHCPADLLACIGTSRPATKAEYAPLARELRRRGYQLQIVKRTPRDAYQLRRIQTNTGVPTS